MMSEKLCTSPTTARLYALSEFDREDVDAARDLFRLLARGGAEVHSASNLRAAFVDEVRSYQMNNCPQQPGLAARLRLLGLFALRVGLVQISVACLANAARSAPCSATDFVDLGDALKLAGDEVRAMGAYLRALRGAHDDVALYERLGSSLARQRRFLEAAALFQEGLRLNPNHARLHCRLGEVLQALDRMSEAINHYEFSIRCESSDTYARRRLGQAHLKQGNWYLAESSFRAGLESDAQDADLRVGLGRSLVCRGEYEDGMREFRAALTADPTHLDGSRFLALAQELLGKRRESSAAWLAFGVALERRMRFEEAATAYREALARKNDSLRALFKLGVVQIELGRPQEAIPYLEHAIALDPGHSLAHVQLAWAYHMTGDSRRGWQQSAWLCHPHDMRWRSFEQPVWDGSSLEGRTILLWTRPHSGLGDAIQFLRYAPLLKTRGAKVALECQKEFVPLAERIAGVDIVVGRGAPLPLFDVHAPLGLVAVRLHASDQTIPANVPYISIDGHRTEYWARRLRASASKTVGFSWGTARRPGSESKCVSVAVLRPLASMRGIRPVSLQLGPQADELLNPFHGVSMIDVQGGKYSLVDTAAIIQNLDLVITVDTMIAHLAGALARPVWTMLPCPADWRWLTGNDTPWYPTMRLFRQSKRGDWTAVVERMRVALEQFAS